MDSRLNRRQHIQVAASALLTGGAIATSARATEKDLKSIPRQTYRVGVIGHTGRGDFGHGLDKMWRQILDTKVVAISDSAGLSHAKARLPEAETFGDYDKMLRTVQPDLVAVAPRHIDQHYDMCMASIDQGVKGIYVEKPFCQTPHQADKILAACHERGVRLAVAHRNRYHPVLQVVKDLIAKGEIGDPLEIRARGKEDHRGGGLDLWVLGSHVLNIACFLAGSPTACQAELFLGKRRCEIDDLYQGAEGVGLLAGDRLHARFEMSAGVPLFFDSIKNHGSREAGFGLQFIGNQGVIDLRIDREPLAHIRQGNPFQPQTGSSDWKIISSGGINIPEPITNLSSLISSHQAAGQDLIRAIRSASEPLCNAREGRETIEMICGVFASHQRDGESIRFPLDHRKHPFE